MSWQYRPFDAAVSDYEQQASELLAGLRGGEEWAIRIFAGHHPRFLDEKIPWLGRPLEEGEIERAGLDLPDARMAVARKYDFRDWEALAEYAEKVRVKDGAVGAFEAAVEAVIGGDLAALRWQLGQRPELVRMRSTRVCCFDPPVHGATLLHYLAANGVEGYRQKTPWNAVEVMRVLLGSGAEPDALAWMYGGECTTLSMLASSTPPAQAGVQVGMMEALVEAGASLAPRGSGNWVSPVQTALVFGFVEAAEALVRLGAKVEDLAVAAGLGRLDLVREFLAGASELDLRRGLALASQLGRTEVVQLLVKAGADVDTYAPEGMHKHTTPLHQAALAGHVEVIKVLLAAGARRDIRDGIYEGTALDWAMHGGQREAEALLRS
jgi:hypothetical protein